MKSLFNNEDCQSYPTLQKEGIQHREMCMMKLMGMTAREIAEKMDVTTACVNTTLAQPFAKQFMVEMVHEKTEGQIEKMLQLYAKDAITTLHELSQEAKSEAVRANSAFALVKAAVGTKLQVVDAPKSLEAIEKEEARLTDEITLLRGRN